MGVPKWLSSMFTVDDTIISTQFSLIEAETSDSGNSNAANNNPSTGKTNPSRDDTDNAGDVEQDSAMREETEDERSGEDEPEFIRSQRPIPLSKYVRQSEEQAATRKAVTTDSPLIPARLKVVHERLNRSFHLPDNKDIVIREFYIGIDKRWPAIAVFVDGLANTLLVNTNLLEPLMLLSHITEHNSTAERIDTVMDALLPSNQVAVVDHWEEAVAGILTGSTAIFVEDSDSAIIAESKGWEHRSVGTPQTENVVNGPHQAFTESFRANTALVRSLLRSPDLVTEMLSVGRLAKTDVAIMYIHGLTNERLVAEIRRRIKAIDVDYLADTGTLSQFIEDNPRVWLPQTLTTERPDRVAQSLSEGYVAIFVGQSSFVMVAPMVFFGLMQAAEDAYLRFPFGSFLRLIRWLSLLSALFIPALYVSVTNYHPEMIPTDLMMAIAGSREQVPFPVIVEVLMMELAIELIREAGIRIPSIIGPTIGIVGALIIGQAAVQAGVVSPLLVIVIAVTALASFTIPNYNLQFGVRILRFVFLLVAALFGFYGLTLAIVAVLARLTVQQSLGVPLFSPAAPKSDSSRDAFLRGPAFEMNQRPLFLYPQKSWRQKPYTRPWSGVSGSESVMKSESKSPGGQSSGSSTKRGGARSATRSSKRKGSDKQ